MREYRLEERIDEVVVVLQEKLREMEGLRAKVGRFQERVSAEDSDEEIRVLEERFREIQERIVRDVRAQSESQWQQVGEGVRQCNLDVLQSLSQTMAQKFDEINFSALNEPFQRLAERLDLALPESFRQEVAGALADLNRTFTDSFREFLSLNQRDLDSSFVRRDGAAQDTPSHADSSTQDEDARRASDSQSQQASSQASSQ